MDFFTFKEQLTQRSDAPEAGKVRTPPLTVSQLTGMIDKSLKSAFPATLHVKGEMSGVKHQVNSGHYYFTLKDPGACIDCVMFKSDAGRLKFVPQDGMEMLASGRIEVYPQRGRYQLYVSRLEPIGQGALELAFRQLCDRLEREGLFAQERKKPLPSYPLNIALVTSAQAAALQDILKVLRRFSWLRLYLHHVPVQGKGSAARIAGAISDISQHNQKVEAQAPASPQALPLIDLIILSRGGGSLEDLWEFNEEVVARAIATSGVPVLTGIGHEVDVSVADLVADYHAHTPTEAAQVATQYWKSAAEELEGITLRLTREMRGRFDASRQRLQQVLRHELFRRPMERVDRARQLLDDRQRAMELALGSRLRRLQSQMHALTTRLEQFRPAALILRLRSRLSDSEQALVRVSTMRLRLAHERLARLTARLRERHPRHRIELGRQRVTALSERLNVATRQLVQRHRDQLKGTAAHLNAIGPEQVLRRGYSITSVKKTGQVLRSASQVKAGERIVTRLADGTVESTADDPNQLPLFE